MTGTTPTYKSAFAKANSLPGKSHIRCAFIFQCGFSSPQKVIIPFLKATASERSFANNSEATISDEPSDNLSDSCCFCTALPCVKTPSSVTVLNNTVSALIVSVNLPSTYRSTTTSPEANKTSRLRSKLTVSARISVFLFSLITESITLPEKRIISVFCSLSFT